jgi:hypothetical protein
MPSSDMWRRVGLVRTDVSKELVSSIFRVELHIPEDGIPHSRSFDQHSLRNRFIPSPPTVNVPWHTFILLCTPMSRWDQRGSLRAVASNGLDWWFSNSGPRKHGDPRSGN